MLNVSLFTCNRSAFLCILHFERCCLCFELAAIAFVIGISIGQEFYYIDGCYISKIIIVGTLQ